MKWETFHITGIYPNHTCLNVNWKNYPCICISYTPAIKLLNFPWSLVHRSVNAQVDVLTYHDFYTPRNEVEGGGGGGGRGGGYTGFTLSVGLPVRPSVCRTNRVRSVSSTILAGSISYLHILSRNCRWCVACYFFHFGKYFNFVTLTLSPFDFGSDMNQWYG